MAIMELWLAATGMMSTELGIVITVPPTMMELPFMRGHMG
jgi:hypothetical protein